MHRYAVGEMYNPALPVWPEGAQFNVLDGAPDLVVALDAPTASEIAAYRTGPARFALHVPGQAALFLLYRFGERGEWSDAPFSWWRVPADRRQVMPESEHPERRHLLHITLLDAPSGIVRVLRASTLSPEFTQALSAAVNDQALRETTAAEMDAEIAAAYARFPTAADMARAAAVRCTGGD